MSDNILSSYKENADQQDFFKNESAPVSKVFKGMRLEVDPQKGRGWTELVENDNGACVGLYQYTLDKQVTGYSTNASIPLFFSIFISGSFNFQFGSGGRNSIQPGQVWCCRKFTEELFFSQQPGEELRALSLMLPASLVGEWLGNSSCGLSGSLERLVWGNLGQSQPLFPLSGSLQKRDLIIRKTQELFHSRRITLCEKLHFEALALELLAQILSVDCRSNECDQKERKIRSAVDEAVDILHREWAAPPTISGLARRVGLNECYLKSGFRKYTGQTIGEYVRGERMARALELVESGTHSILEIALKVGYTNPSHFSAAFKRFYGYAPSRYVRQDVVWEL